MLGEGGGVGALVAVVGEGAPLELAGGAEPAGDRLAAVVPAAEEPHPVISSTAAAAIHRMFL